MRWHLASERFPDEESPVGVLGVRLALALEHGLFDVPAEGRIAVIGARAGGNLSALPKDRVEVVQRHYPDYQAFEAAGYTCAVELTGDYALSVIVLPRSKAEARTVLARAARVTTGPLVIDGQKTDGVDSLLKEIRTRAKVGEVLSKAHGKIFVVSEGAFDDWLPPVADPMDGSAPRTAPGVFSADGIDPGSAALIAALPDNMKGHVVDLGAGWGVLAEAVLQRGAASVDLVEADHVALEAARRNISDDRARFHWADARDFQPETRPDHVVCNPPFHTLRTADPGLGQAFIRAAARMLPRHGTLWLVANRHLPYEKVLDETFRDIQTLSGPPEYKLTRARQPRSLRKG